MQTARIGVLLALAGFLGACAAVLGLDDHEPYPPGDASDAADGPACGDTQTDPSNCGGCGVVCKTGYACVAGGCGNQVAAVAAGAHGCVLLRGGEVWCWGQNVAGQLGVRADACTTTCPAPAKVIGVSRAVELSVGVSSSCVRDAAGVVSCWGQNDMGQLGDSPDAAACAYGGACSATPQVVPIPPAVQIAVGSSYACARLADGSLRCWGDNTYGELGEGAPTTGPHPTAATVTITSDVVDVATGRTSQSTCATKKDGTIWCWGQNTRGILGHTGGGDTGCPVGSSTPVACNATPSPVPNFSSFTSSSISRVTCAKSAADFYCWGFNGFGQLGLGIVDGVDHAVPALVTTMKPTSISPGVNHTCALDATGAAWCWGYNFWGDLGDGTIRSPTACEGGSLYCVPKSSRVVGVPTLASVSAGAELTLALGVDGTVWAWGANPDGRTGHPAGGVDGGVADQDCTLVVNDAGAGGPCTARPTQVSGLP